MHFFSNCSLSPRPSKVLVEDKHVSKNYKMQENEQKVMNITWLSREIGHRWHNIRKDKHHGTALQCNKSCEACASTETYSSGKTWLLSGCMLLHANTQLYNLVADLHTGSPPIPKQMLQYATKTPLVWRLFQMTIHIRVMNGKQTATQSSFPQFI